MTLQLNWFHLADHSPIYMALKKGYYKEEDLELNVVRGAGSADSAKKIDLKQAEVGISDADRDYRHQQGRQSEWSRWYTTRPATTPSSRRAPTSARPRIIGKKVAVPPAELAPCALARIRRAQQARPGGGDAGQREAGGKQAIVASGDVDAAFDLYTSYAIWEKVLGKGNVGHLCGRLRPADLRPRTSSTPSSSRRIRS